MDALVDNLVTHTPRITRAPSTKRPKPNVDDLVEQLVSQTILYKGWLRARMTIRQKARSACVSYIAKRQNVDARSLSSDEHDKQLTKLNKEATGLISQIERVHAGKVTLQAYPIQKRELMARLGGFEAIDKHDDIKRLRKEIAKLDKQAEVLKVDVPAEMTSINAVYGRVFARTPLDTGIHLYDGQLRPYLEAMACYDPYIDHAKTLIRQLAEKLPVASVVLEQKGFDALNLGLLVGSCRDLSKYHKRSHTELWKRMGLGVLSNGRKQGRYKDADLAIEAGFDPHRRAIAWQIGTCLLMAGNERFKPIYDSHKTAQLAKGITRGHAHDRAQRAMTKSFLKWFHTQWMRSV